jgi:hypothetical protein
MTLLLVTISFLGVSSPAPVSPTPLKCPSVKIDKDFLWWRLGPSVAKSGPPPGGTARSFLRYKDNWLRDCPHNEIVWYSILRATELTTQDRKAPMDLIEAARTAVPGSVWIETVRARALGTVEAAEAAIRLAPKHVPAQVALAAALCARRVIVIGASHPAPHSGFASGRGGTPPSRTCGIGTWRYQAGSGIRPPRT